MMTAGADVASRPAAARAAVPPAAGTSPPPRTAAAKAPPALLPGEHFAAALLFLLLGALGAVVHAQDLAGGYFLSARVAAVTHLFTLGWITTSIMGALYQFLPVALDRPIRSLGVAHATFALYAPGLLAFVVGLAFVRPTLMLVGAAALGTGVLLFIGNLGATLRAATRRDVTWWALALATLYLGFTLVLGLGLTGNLKLGYLGGSRLTALGVHLHVALAGWVLLVMIGVGHRLLPMFLLSHGAGDRYTKFAVALTASGAGMLALLHHAPRPFSYWLPALLIAAGCGAFLLQARAFFARRHRRTLDAGMRLAAAALALLGVAMLLAVPVLVLGQRGSVAVAYVAAIILAMSLFVAAHFYRIIPFLVWYHRCGPLAGRRPIPGVHDLYSARAAGHAGAALAVGAMALVVSVASGAPTAAAAGALILLTGVFIMTAQMLLLWRFRP
jgi:hypothetical protein